MARAKHFLEAWRARRQLTQEQLAERMGVVQTTIARLESGKRQLTETTIMRLAIALQLPHPGAIFRAPDDQIWVICERISALTPEQREVADRLITALSTPRHGNNANDTAK